MASDTQETAGRCVHVIAVSSCRPFTDPNSEYGRNQIAAHKSWENAFDLIVYFNEPVEHLDGPTTLFLPHENFPRIVELAEFCSTQSDWCALLNADIVVGDRFRLVERKLKRSRNASAAVSWRYEFDPQLGMESARVVDNGLDFFAATPAVWRQASLLLHPRVRLGAQSWDTQALSFFSTYAIAGFYDLTPARVIFHPKHGGRSYGPCVPPDQIRVWAAPVMPIASIK
jgi:hypothetical protein